MPPAPRPKPAALRWATQEHLVSHRPGARAAGGQTRSDTPRPALRRPAPPDPTQPLTRADDAVAPASRPSRASSPSSPSVPDRTSGTLRPTPAVLAPAPRSRPGRVLFWLLAVVAVLALVTAGLVLAGVTNVPRTTARLSAAEVTFKGLMARDETAQKLAEGAVAHPCRPASPASAARAASLGHLGRAVSLRQSVLRGIGADKGQLLGMPDGGRLVADLTKAARTGLAVDQDDQGWLRDLQATGCYSAPTNDIHFRAAALAGPAATRAAERVAADWAKAVPHPGH